MVMCIYVMNVIKSEMFRLNLLIFFKFVVMYKKIRSKLKYLSSNLYCSLICKRRIVCG